MAFEINSWGITPLKEGRATNGTIVELVVPASPRVGGPVPARAGGAGASLGKGPVVRQHQERFWTIQPLDVWQTIQAQGEVWVDESRLPIPNFVPWPYQWLRAQLMKRLAGYRGNLPWWCYGEKPDLRTYRFARTGPEVRLEVACAPGRILRFPLWAWHEIYCGQYLSLESKKRRDFYRRLARALPDWEEVWPWPEPWKSELESSWQLLFQADLPRRYRGRTSIFSEATSTIAVLECIQLRDVRKVTPFVGVDPRPV